MSPLLAAALFVVSLVVTLAAARLFARRLDRLGTRFGFPEALVGVLTAVAADGPEVTSALVALAKGAHNVSVGVLIGSNAFNLAAMIGLRGYTGSTRIPASAARSSTRCKRLWSSAWTARTTDLISGSINGRVDRSSTAGSG